MKRWQTLPLANMAVAIGAFGIASMMAVMQAMSRADLHMPGRTPKIYYLSVTAHGVLMALVFTTFFIMGFGYVVVHEALGEIPWPKVAWGGFWVTLTGTALATVAILSGQASVLYTFYPPMEAHPIFYIGAALLIVGSWAWAVVTIKAWLDWRRKRPEKAAPLPLHGMTATSILWLVCTLGVAIEVVFLLIPWSLGWYQRVDPLAARTLFWYFGHPLVYFWILPAYVAWYTVLPRAVGGKTFSDKLARMVFVMFILLSTPVGIHHQLMDPGIPAKWKLFHAMLTFAIIFPSLLTAFTVIASVEVGGRLAGGRGTFGWLAKLPWGEPLFTSVVLAMAVFAIGGFGGAINAAYNMNSMIHNTAWVQGHFHLTVGTAAALTFMGLSYWLLPRLTGRELKFQAFAQVQPWLWFGGMMFFSIANHITGLLGMPRRVYEAGYHDLPQAARWAPWTAVSAAGGVILFVSAMSFILVMVGTALWGKKLEKTPPIEWAESLEPVEGPGIWDRFGMWTALAALLIIITYAIPLWDICHLPRYGSPPFRPF